MSANNRLNIIQTRHSRVLPAPGRGLRANGATNQHILAEMELVDTVAEFIQNTALVEAETMLVNLDLIRTVEVYDRARVKLEAFRKKHQSFVSQANAALIFDSRCVDFAMASRLSSYLQRTPSPCGPARQESLKSMGFLPTATIALIGVLDDIAPFPATSLPSYVVYMLTFALVYARRIYGFMLKRYGSITLINIADVEAAEQKVHLLGGTPSLILAHTAAGHAAESMRPDNGGGMELPDGFSLFDLVSWDFGEGQMNPEMGFPDSRAV